MPEQFILTDKEIKIFNRAGWIWLGLCLLFAALAVYHFMGYKEMKLSLQQKEEKYAYEEEETRRLKRFVSSIKKDAQSPAADRTLNAVTRE